MNTSRLVFLILLVLSLGLNLWTLAKSKSLPIGGGVSASTKDQETSAVFVSLRETNALRMSDVVYGELRLESPIGKKPELFKIQFQPAAVFEQDFREDAKLRWLDDDNVIEATTPYLTLRFDLQAFNRYLHSRQGT
jgi:hypothetical protein